MLRVRVCASLSRVFCTAVLVASPAFVCDLVLLFLGIGPVCVYDCLRCMQAHGTHTHTSGSEEYVSYLRSRFTAHDPSRRGVVATKDVAREWLCVCVFCSWP